MNRLISAIVMLLAAISASAQDYMHIWQNGEKTTYLITSIDSIVFEAAPVERKVTVSFDGSEATVDCGKIPGLTYTRQGADVVITNTNVEEELQVVLQGNSSNGSVTYNGDYKCTFTLNGLNLTSNTGAALNILCGKRVGLVLADGTENSLADAATGAQKAALYCKGHMEVEGSGSLTVSGNARHAIATKEYLQLKKTTGTITIARAASDAFHAGQYFQMNGGVVYIDANTVADGIQAEYAMLDDDVTPDPEKENNGQVIIKGGTINAVIANQDCKAVKADGDITISGGTLDLKPKANGSRGIQTDGNIVIGEESAPTSITIATEGGKCTLAECAEDPHRCMGIKVDGNLTVNAGTVTVTHTKSAARDIKVGGTYTNNGGTVTGVVVN